MIFFILSLIGLCAVVGVIYYFIPCPEVLWFGGATVLFWILDKIRQMMEDNFFLNSAMISVSSVFMVVPYFFLGRTLTSFLLFMWCGLFIGFQLLTHSDYFYGYIRSRDFDNIWTSNYITPVKERLHYYAAEANKAAIIFILIGYLAVMVCLGGVIDTYGLLFTALPPVFILLCNIGTLVVMHLRGVDPPTGYSDHDNVDNIVKGYWYLISRFFGGIFFIIASPFLLIIHLCKMIGALFSLIREGGTARISTLYWVCAGLLGVYCLLGVFGVANFVEEFFEALGIFDKSFIYTDFYLTQLVATWDFGKTFFGAIFLFIPYVVLVIISGILEFLFTILTAIFTLIFWIVMFLLMFAVEQILPIIILIGAIALLVMYLIDSDREAADWFRFIFFTVITVGMTVLYFLLYSGIIKVFG